MSTEILKIVGWLFQSYPPVSQDRSQYTLGSSISVCSRHWRSGSQCSVLMTHLSVLKTLESRVSVQCPHGSSQCARDTGELGLSAVSPWLISVCSRHWRAGSQCSVLMAHLSVLETLESRVSVQCPHGSSQCARDTGEPGLSAVCP